MGFLLKALGAQKTDVKHLPEKNTGRYMIGITVYKFNRGKAIFVDRVDYL